jgi:hypothetical protein
MTSIRRLVNDIVSGSRPLNIETAREIIDSATSDKRIENTDELAPLRDLFAGDEVRSAFDSTRGGAAFLQGFMKHAQAHHDDVGDARSSQTRGLKPLAARYATDTLLSKDALEGMVAEYRGTQPGERFTRPAEPGDSNSVTVTPKWVEEVRSSLVKYVTTYMAGSRLQRLWQAMGESSNVDWKAQYNSPVKTFEGWLAHRSAKRSPTGAGPLDSQVRAFERQKIKNALNTAGGDHDRAAAILGLTLSGLERKIAEHGL